MYWVVLGEAFNCQLLFAELRNVWCVGTVNFRHIEISVAFEVAYFSFHADVWALFLKRKNCFFECTTEHLWHTVCTVSISYPLTHNIKKLVSVITLTGYVRDTEHMDFTLVNHHPVRTFLYIMSEQWRWLIFFSENVTIGCLLSEQPSVMTGC